ncbi:MAG: serine hydrolase domain-containing protein [Pseudomonadales bacterium]
MTDVWRLATAVGLLLLGGIARTAEPPVDGSTTVASERPVTADFETFLDGVMAAQFEDYKLVGATFSLVLDGEPVLSKGYGQASLATGAPVDPALTLFRPGSVSKLFTWTAVMQLVEQGRLDLNAPVSGYVSQFELPDAFGQPLTLTHIMTHTPGLEDGGAGFLFADEPEDLVPLADSLAAHVPTQVRPPGTFASYSNWATSLAGLVVANVSGQSFESYVAEHIFAPLGMTQATFDEPLPAGLAPHMAQGYTAKYGGVEPMGFEYIHNFGPAGALSASAADMARFISAQVSGGGAAAGGRILSPATTALMHQRLFAHDDRVAGMAHGFYEIFRNGERFVGHAGDTIAFHSELVIQSESGFGFFLSFNTPEGATARTGVTNAVLDWFYPGDGGASPAFPEAPLAGTEARIEQVVGAYRFNRRSYTRLEGSIGLGGDIRVMPAGADGVFIPGELGGRFIEVAPYQFRQQLRQDTLVFQTDDGGRVTRALVGAIPVMVADRLAAWEQAATHQLVIALALLAAVFVLINAVRNRRTVSVSGSARLARWCLIGASLSFLAFVVAFGVAMGEPDMAEMIFDFPPPGTGIALAFPVIGAGFTLLAVGFAVPVWRSPDCNLWQRLRYTYVTLIFVLLVAVLAYWNLLGWRY